MSQIIDKDYYPLYLDKHSGLSPIEIAKIDPQYIVDLWRKSEASDRPCSLELYLRCFNIINDRGRTSEM